MEFQIPIKIPVWKDTIRYGQKLMLVGSCFTEHIGDRLNTLKFDVLQNPHGILFDPQSVASSLSSYIKPHLYQKEELFYYNELWQSWQHHSRFSGLEKTSVLQAINDQQIQAHSFLNQADWLIITLGSSFSYRLTALVDAIHAPNGSGTAVANCHRAPSQWFQKHMMGINETYHALKSSINALREFNPRLKIIFTISPVRHIRDGIVENNQSKARLIEVVHQLELETASVYYFPAYELVMDVLRDYRFYDIDLVHPNYAATRFVMEHFMQHCVDADTRIISEEVQQIVTARNHKAFQPNTEAHQKFLQSFLEKTKQLAAANPYLNFEEELIYFSESRIGS